MKPKEFDELIRQKFEQNDFAYDPRSWDKLAEQMDGRAKKRNVMMWWWMPLAGMAASVALAMGITTLIRMDNPAGKAATQLAQSSTYLPQHLSPSLNDDQTDPFIATSSAAVNDARSTEKNNNAHRTARPTPKGTAEWIGLTMNNVGGNSGNSNTAVLAAAPHTDIDLMSAPAKAEPAKKKKPEVLLAQGYETFKPEVAAAPAKPVRFSIILSGGVSHGAQTSGYTAGATIRRMVNDKVYVESDIAFTTSDNVQKTQYLDMSGSGGGMQAAAKHSAGKSSGIEASRNAATIAPEGVIKTQDDAYSLYYAQVSPSVGYKIMKRMSVAAGPDFQKALADNRPATSTVDRGNIQVAPLFDIGFIGKTEYSLTKNIKAGVSYRKGMNNIITPMDKYIDRDYLQFQLKCAIFNK